MRSRRFFHFAFAVVAAMAAISTYSRATEFEIYGGKGDTSIPDGCEAGWYVTGFKIKSGAWFDKIGIICARYVGNQTLSAASRRTVAMRGGDGGGGPQDFTCEPNEYVSSIWITRDDGYHVSALSLTCSQFQYAVGRNIDYGTLGKYNRRQICPTGEAAWGVRTAYGKYVNGLGLICRKLEFGPPGATSDEGCNINGTIRKDIAPADCKEAQTTGCIKHLLTDAQYARCMKANKPKPSDEVCRGYAERMVSMTSEAAALKCAFINCKGCGWSEEPKDYWERECKSGDGRMAYNEPALKQEFDKCKADLAGGGGNNGGGNAGGPKATAVASNKVYKTPSGEDTAENTVCTMRAGDTATVIETGPDQWVHLGDITGGCGGKSGWAWNDGELNLP